MILQGQAEIISSTSLEQLQNIASIAKLELALEELAIL